MLNREILDKFKGKKCLVTGGTGMIGREVTRLLLYSGAEVWTVSMEDIGLSDHANMLYASNNQGQWYHRKVDLSNFHECKSYVADKDFIFHVAGIKGSVEVTKSKPASFLVPLTMMNTNLLEAARQAGCKNVLYTSSIGAYKPADVFVEGVGDDGEPMDLAPGHAKRLAEKQIQAYQTQYGLEYRIIRPCNVFGPFDNFDPNNAMVIPSLMAKVKKFLDTGEAVEVWGDGSAIRDFLFARDCAEGIILAMVKGTKTEIANYLNLGSGKGYTIKQLVESLQQIVPFQYRFLPEKSGGYPKRVMDMTLTKKTLDWEPETSLVEGLSETWKWFLENPKQYEQRKNYFTEVK